MATRRKRRSREFKKDPNIISIDEAREARRRKREEELRKRKVSQKTQTEDRTVSREDGKNGESTKTLGKKAKKKKYSINLFKLVISIGLIVVLSFLTYNLVQVKIEESEVKAENERLLEEKAQMEEELKQVDDPEYIEDQAREGLDLVMPGELVFEKPEEE